MVLKNPDPKNQNLFYFEAKLKIASGARAVIILQGKVNTLQEAPVAVFIDPTKALVGLSNWGLWVACVPRHTEAMAHHSFAENGEISIQMVMRGEILEVFFDSRHSLSTRVNRGTGALGLFSREGPISWQNVQIRKLE